MTLDGTDAYPIVGATFWPSESAHFMKSVITLARFLSFGSSYIKIHVNDETGYAPCPGAFVIDTRKSFGMFAAAPAAAAVTESVLGVTNSPAWFSTAP